MSAPTLLLNHKFWIDHHGNSVAVGKPIELYASKLVKLKDNSDDWGIKDIATGKVVNKFPKSKMPNLVNGDEGLFVVAEITQSEVKEMVERGELQAFSWRGLVNVDFKVNEDGTTSRVLTDIDLYEISLVNVPANPDATLVIGKADSAGEFEIPLVVHQVKLDREFFQEDGDALRYLHDRKLLSDSIRSDQLSHYSLQKSAAEFDLAQLVSVKLREGVHVIAGPLLADKAQAFGGTTPLGTTSVLGGTDKERIAQLEKELKKKKKGGDKGKGKSKAPKAPKAAKPKTTKPAGTASDQAKWKKALAQAVEAQAQTKELDAEQGKLENESADLIAKRDAALLSGNSAEVARLDGALKDNKTSQRSNADAKAKVTAGESSQTAGIMGYRDGNDPSAKAEPTGSSISRGDKFKRDGDGQFASGNIGGPGRPKTGKAASADGLRLVAAKSLSSILGEENQMAEEITTVLEEEQLETQDQSVVADEAADDSAEEVSAETSEDMGEVDTEKAGYKKKQPPVPEGEGGGAEAEGGKPKCGPNQVYDEASEKCVASKETEELSILASFLAEETAKGISAQLTPVFESFSDSLKVIGTGMEAMAAKMVLPEAVEETKAETKPEPEPEAEAETEAVKTVTSDPVQSVASVLTNLQAQLVETQKQVTEVAKTAEAISQSTPDPIDREEKLKAAEADQDDNGCFNNLWPFLG
jgi:hypothetical protein